MDPCPPPLAGIQPKYLPDLEMHSQALSVLWVPVRWPAVLGSCVGHTFQAGSQLLSGTFMLHT